MSGIGGPVESVTLAGREFSVAGDADVGSIIGGKTNELEANGNNTARLIKKPRLWELSDLQLSISLADGDLEFLQDLADSLEFFNMSATYPDGKVYKGRAQISGDISHQTQSATATVTLKGPQKLT